MGFHIGTYLALLIYVRSTYTYTLIKVNIEEKVNEILITQIN